MKRKRIILFGLLIVLLLVVIGVSGKIFFQDTENLSDDPITDTGSGNIEPDVSEEDELPIIGIEPEQSKQSQEQENFIVSEPMDSKNEHSEQEGNESAIDMPLVPIQSQS